MIHLTYTGSCELAGVPIMCSSMSASLDQKVTFFDHILGLRDTTDGFTKGGDAGTGNLGNTQKKIYRYSPAIAKASISGPVPSEGFQTILDAAVSGATVSANCIFYKNSAPNVTVSNAIISSLTIDIKGGDIAQFSAEVTGATYDYTTGTSNIADCAKLITWDACSVTGIPGDYDMSSFSISISNPPIPIYTSKWTTDTFSGGMMPQKIRIGMQEVTGSVGVYGPSNIDTPKSGAITFSLNGVGKTVQVKFVAPKDDASGGPYIRTVTFVGVNDGSIWS